jgi:hypothetical protein
MQTAYSSSHKCHPAGSKHIDGNAQSAFLQSEVVSCPCRGTLARQASQWQPQYNELDMLRLLYLLRDVGCGLKLLNSQSIVHADLVRRNAQVCWLNNGQYWCCRIVGWCTSACVPNQASLIFCRRRLVPMYQCIGDRATTCPA